MFSNSNVNLYLLQDDVDASLRSGAIAKVNGLSCCKQAGISLAKDRLKTAATLFKETLGTDFQGLLTELDDDIESNTFRE